MARKEEGSGMDAGRAEWSEGTVTHTSICHPKGCWERPHVALETSALCRALGEGTGFLGGLWQSRATPWHLEMLPVEVRRNQARCVSKKKIKYSNILIFNILH